MLNQKVPARQFDFWNFFNKGLYGVQFFEYSSYQKSTEFMNFQIFLFKFKKHPSKIVEELIFSLFLFISDENIDIYRKCSLGVTKETKLDKKFIKCSLKVNFQGHR